MIGFSQTDAARGNVELVPQGTLARAVISCEKDGFSKPNEEKGTAGGGHYKECKITISEGPFARRVIFHYLSNPEDPKNSDRAKDMGLGALVRMLEAAGVFDPANPASYRPMTFEQAFLELVRAQSMGRTIAIEVGVQKANNPEAMRGVRTLVRNDYGALEDASGRVRKAKDDLAAGDDERMAWAEWHIEDAARRHRPMFRNGDRSLFGLKDILSPVIAACSRRQLQQLPENGAEDNTIVGRLIAAKRVVECSFGQGKNTTTYLDVPGGPYTNNRRPAVEGGEWQAPPHHLYRYDPETKKVVRA